MINRTTALTCGVASLLLCSFFSFANLTEWYSVSILHQVGDYHFGSEGPRPYYYRTPSLYASVTFTWGILFLLNLIYIIRGMAKQNNISTMIGFGLSMILLFGLFIHAQVGAEF